MGTRSITVVKDENNQKIVEMYQQYDGYPDGVGIDLLKFIGERTIINGFKSHTDTGFNGISCFAAQLVAEFKNGVGGTYLYAPSVDYKDKRKYSENYSAEYYYEIQQSTEGTLKVTCWDCIENKIVEIGKS